MQSVMKHDFSKVPTANIRRSTFMTPFTRKQTMSFDYIYPFYVDEMLPADTYQFDGTMFCRFTSPLLYPILDNIHMDIFFFAVPNRILWTNWVKLQGEQVDPDDSTDYTVPYVQAPASTGWVTGELWDYLGIPINVQNLQVSALFSRAYQKIYNTYFRDENLIDSVTVDVDDGPDTESDYELRKRCKRHDYFTSCLPWAQKDPDSIISLPLGDTAPVYFDATGADNRLMIYDDAGTIYDMDVPSTKVESAAIDSGHAQILVDLAGADGPDIAEFREAILLQRLLEVDARSGTRYPEILKAHFGVWDPQMAVLQYPEYIGGSTAPCRVTPVPQTSQSDTTDQGTLAAFSTISMKAGFTYSATEHMVLLGLVCCRADLTYSQGLPRMFSRSTRYDFYMPELAGLSEQGVLNQEIWCTDPATDTDTDGTPDNEEIFGYQERWAEYKYKPSEICGKLKSDATGTLHAWHLSQDFATCPTLSQTFIEEDVPWERIVASSSEPPILFDSFCNIKKTRPMPVHCVPGLGSRL